MIIEMMMIFSPLFSRKWFAQQSGPGRPSLIKAIFKTFWWEYTVLGFIAVFNDIFIRLAQPIFLGMLLQYFR